MSEFVVDTREAGRRSCADVTTSAVNDLPVGDTFVLVADHDPTPLKYMLNAEHPGECSWSPLEDGPDLWKVRVGRTAQKPVTPSP